MIAESIMLEFWNLQDTCFIGFHEISSAFWLGDHFLDVARCLAMNSFEDDQQCFEFNPVLDWKPCKRNECRSYAIIFLRFKTRLAAVFLTCRSFLMRFSGNPFINSKLVPIVIPSHYLNQCWLMQLVVKWICEGSLEIKHSWNSCF